MFCDKVISVVETRHETPSPFAPVQYTVVVPTQIHVEQNIYKRQRRPPSAVNQLPIKRHVGRVPFLTADRVPRPFWADPFAMLPKRCQFGFNDLRKSRETRLHDPYSIMTQYSIGQYFQNIDSLEKSRENASMFEHRKQLYFPSLVSTFYVYAVKMYVSYE